jgi:hypothetical protein
MLFLEHLLLGIDLNHLENWRYLRSRQRWLRNLAIIRRFAQLSVVAPFGAATLSH